MRKFEFIAGNLKPIVISLKIDYLEILKNAIKSANKNISGQEAFITLPISSPLVKQIKLTKNSSEIILVKIYSSKEWYGDYWRLSKNVFQYELTVGTKKNRTGKMLTEQAIKTVVVLLKEHGIKCAGRYWRTRELLN